MDSGDGSIKVWRAADGECLHTLVTAPAPAGRQHSGPVDGPVNGLVDDASSDETASGAAADKSFWLSRAAVGIGALQCSADGKVNAPP
eukprot:1179558-Prorocentrum_minimum.AAC.2